MTIQPVQVTALYATLRVEECITSIDVFFYFSYI